MNSCLNSVGAPSFPSPQAVASAPVTYDSTDSGPQQWPSVSVVMPVLNEERHLADAVGGVMAQDYAGPFEVILGLGPSTDDTDRIAAALSAQDPRVRTVSNPTGKTAAGLNAAMAVADPSSLYVIRVDANHRDPLLTSGKIDGIPYGVHYSLACHQHPFMAHQPSASWQHLPNSEHFAASVLSLPLNPYLTANDVDIVSSHLQYTYRP